MHVRRRTTTSSGELLPHIAPLMKTWYLSAKYFWCLARHHKSLFRADQLFFKRLNIFVSVASLFDLLDLPPGDFFWSHFTCSSPDKVKCHFVNPAFIFCLCFVLLFHYTPPPPIIPFQRHLSSPFFTVPHCLLRAATVWPRHRHWPRPLRRPKSNILTCLLPEWWFIKKLSWLRKKIDSHR